MYKENLFNGWAEKYDKDVYNTEKFTFKNYKDVLFKIYNQIPEEKSKVSTIVDTFCIKTTIAIGYHWIKPIKYKGIMFPNPFIWSSLKI